MDVDREPEESDGDDSQTTGAGGYLCQAISSCHIRMIRAHPYTGREGDSGERAVDLYMDRQSDDPSEMENAPLTIEGPEPPPLPPRTDLSQMFAHCMAQLDRELAGQGHFDQAQGGSPYRLKGGPRVQTPCT